MRQIYFSLIAKINVMYMYNIYPLPKSCDNLELSSIVMYQLFVLHTAMIVASLIKRISVTVKLQQKDSRLCHCTS